MQATCVLLFHLKHDITTEIAILLPSALAASFSEAVPLEEKSGRAAPLQRVDALIPVLPSTQGRYRLNGLDSVRTYARVDRREPRER